MLALLNDAGFLEHIGDRGVRTIDEARDYIASGAVASYERHGFGLYLVTLPSDGSGGGTAIGLCGLVKRDTLDDADLGFAFLPDWRRQGYAREAASAVVAYSRGVLRLPRLAAIVAPRNHASLRLLADLGFRYERRVRMAPDVEEIELHGLAL
ncbi:MAG: GNAT family N-acetyltransferase [Gemmatimonadales bacterium]|nr:GNAT family N-acetyltransferase [Gemmatimonadales bacterium]